MKDLQPPRRITQDGSPNILNGVADWVYEEEVFESTVAQWWSKDGSHLAWIKFNDEKVMDYYYPLYNEGQDLYPHDVDIKYPKVD